MISQSAILISQSAIPERSRRSAPRSGSAKRCATGSSFTAVSRRHTTGHAPTHTGGAARRSNASRAGTDRRHPPSPTSTAPVRPHTPTRSQPGCAADELAHATARQCSSRPRERVRLPYPPRRPNQNHTAGEPTIGHAPAPSMPTSTASTRRRSHEGSSATAAPGNPASAQAQTAPFEAIPTVPPPAPRHTT